MTNRLPSRLTLMSFSSTPGSSAVTSKVSLVSATLIAGTPAPTSKEGQFRSNARNMSSKSRRIALNGSDTSSWFLDHKLGSFICPLHSKSQIEIGGHYTFQL